jgi:hypothetical protein
VRRRKKKKPACPAIQWSVDLVHPSPKPIPGDDEPNVKRATITGTVVGTERDPDEEYERDHNLLAIGELVFRKIRRIEVAEVKWSYARIQRCGIGTQLYEQMALVACEEGARLASDTVRLYDRRTEVGASDRFWQKQVHRKRARCLWNRGAHPGYYNDDQGRQHAVEVGVPPNAMCDQYVMKQSCMSPGALGKLRASVKGLSGTMEGRPDWRERAARGRKRKRR